MIGENKINTLIRDLLVIRNFMIAQEDNLRKHLMKVHPDQLVSAKNLIHYLGLRAFKLKKVQAELSNLGLSSIGHSEGYTLANINHILRWLYLLKGEKYVIPTKSNHEPPLTYFRNLQRLRKNTKRLFLQQKYDGNKLVMVTLPTEAASNPKMIRQLLKSGMNIARINCSHDNEEVWLQIIKRIKHESKALKLSCPIYMDLSGPKIRTGPIKDQRYKKKGRKKGKNSAAKGPFILLKRGDVLHLYRSIVYGKPAKINKKGKIKHPARIAVTAPEIFDFIKKGETLWFDDGKIGTVIESVHPEFAELKVTHCKIKGGKLRAGKGINLPDTELDLPSLTKKDLRDLPFMTKYADLIGYSYVKRPKDIRLLQRKLLKLGKSDIGVILKIENRESFRSLPELILTAMRSPNIGVMIARGDLAIELGWERISEVQEEILWLCEAAHLPTIWATQVLEKLAKEGIASRSEITDAAMSGRSECVMLNKGTYIVEAITMLKDILRRMRSHQQKKKGILRPLKVARDLVGVPIAPKKQRSLTIEDIHHKNGNPKRIKETELDKPEMDNLAKDYHEVSDTKPVHKPS